MTHRCWWLAPIVLAPLASCFGMCGPMNNNGPPDPDSCAAPSTSGIDAVEIGLGNPLDDPVFRVAHDGDVLARTFGGQGTEMGVLRLRVRGPDPPACIDQSIEISDGEGRRIGRNAGPLKTYLDAGGGRSTKPIYVVFEG
ncbi:MAG: hypothetical protein EXR72_03495 [Myxococcales bacterium]|nr:hypothetical protein [Myxococcales bacterium]